MMRPNTLYDYVTAANGVFIRARRAEMLVQFPVLKVEKLIPGLETMKPQFHIEQKVPARTLSNMLEGAQKRGNIEILYHLSYRRPLFMPLVDGWRVTVPVQFASRGNVTPVDPYAGGANTFIELHSHHVMPAFFSATDDADESGGFRIYAVIGEIFTTPKIRVRVGVYGNFWEIDPHLAFDLPWGMECAS